MSIKLALRKPKIPPSTAEEKPPRSVPAKDEDDKINDRINTENSLFIYMFFIVSCTKVNLYFI